MSIFSSYKKIFLLGFIITILVAIPFSVYVAQKRQQTVSKATASTTLSFDPAAPTIKVGDTLVLNITLDPGSNPSTANQVSFVELFITFDASKFATLSSGLSLKALDSGNELKNVVKGPTYTSGKASISLSIPADPTLAIIKPTKIAVLQLKATSETNGTPTNIAFDSSTQILSIDSNSQTSDNVFNLLSTSNPATVTINSAPSSPSTTPTSTPTPTSVPSAGGGTAPSTVTQNQTRTTIPGQTSTSTPASSSSTIIILNPTATPIPIPTLNPAFTGNINGNLPPTGPRNILGIGTIGAIFTIIGGTLFILL